MTRSNKRIQRALQTKQADREVGYFCPECQSIEIEVEKNLIIDPSRKDQGKTATCKLCNWSGPVADLIGAITPKGEQFWDAEKVANVLMGVCLKHGAGPILQALAFVGLLPKIRGGAEEQASAIAIREEVTKEVLAAMMTVAFEAAAKLVKPHYEKFDQEQGEAVEKVFSFAPPEAANDSP
jgi:hypothetical protein